MKVFGMARIAAYVSFGLLGVVALPSETGSGYHLIKKIPLGAAPGGGEYFDYVTVDPAARRIYFAHGAEVKVLDADNFSVVGTISGLKRCHGVVVVQALGKGFITDGDAGKVMVFDIKKLKVTGEIKTYPDTDSLVYDRASKLIFTFNGDSKNSSVIDPVTETMVKTLNMGGGPEQPVADGHGMIYDNIEDTGEVVAIDTRALTVKARWPVAPAGEPVAMAMDRQHRRLFSAGRRPQMLVMMDADNGKVLQSFPITAGVDATVYDPETGMVFSSTREGMIHVFHEDSPDKLRKVDTINTEYGAKTMAMDPKTHNLILITSDFAAGRTIKGTARVLIFGR
ncbi:MAG TPA: YncE family protein [Candidatus Dormibacteraeota bacterium]|nr:YncE family protein [Candidatus Dormibacteraeota bacterium]